MEGNFFITVVRIKFIESLKCLALLRPYGTLGIKGVASFFYQYLVPNRNVP
jgi:hypothetical protein